MLHKSQIGPPQFAYVQAGQCQIFEGVGGDCRVGMRWPPASIKSSTDAGHISDTSGVSPTPSLKIGLNKRNQFLRS